MGLQSTYGGGIRPNEGFYFGMDAMFMYISKPGTTSIGSDVPQEQAYFTTRLLEYTQTTVVGSDSDNNNNNTDTTNSSSSGTGSYFDGDIVNITPGMTLDPLKVYEYAKAPWYNSCNTGLLSNEWVCGRRYDIGYTHGAHGLGVKILDINDLTQDFEVNNAMVVFDAAPRTDAKTQGGTWLEGVVGINGTGSYDFGSGGDTTDTTTTTDGTTGNPDYFIYGNLGVQFEKLYVQNKTETFGIELNYTHRFMPRDHFAMRYGIWELNLGVRYLQFKETFNCSGVGGALSDSYWNTEAINNIVGPQIGLRHFRSYGRWTFDFLGAFTAGVNSQSVSQFGILGSKLSNQLNQYEELIATTTNNNDNNNNDGQDTVDTSGTLVTTENIQGLMGYAGYPRIPTQTFNYKYSDTLFSPVGELQFNAKLQLTNLINLRMGCTGMYIGNIARPSEMIKYELPGTTTAMGVDMNKNDSDSFVYGFTIGLEVNR